MKKKLYAFLTIFFICFSAASPAFFVLADDTVLSISNEKDFLKFAKNCSLDTWSQGKMVIIEKDLDLSKINFVPVQTFGGVFDGKNHTIKGLKISIDASDYGLFRYLQNGALIKDVNIEAVFKITGTKNKTGALVGNNSGTISGCSFKGNINGGTCVGGLVGVNQSGGIINNCNSSGKVYGEHYVGGIAGQNFGQIILCKNFCKVNTVAEEVKLNIENLNLEKLISPENMADITDVGGICGYSAGIVQYCTNKGMVGYEHIGYNVGGICGRQAGYINNCTNGGKINGRKDVGGIVGQMEPYTVLEYSPSSLENVKNNLNDLQAAIELALASAADSKNIIHTRLNAIHEYAKNARDDADALIDKTNDLINGEIDAANDIASRLSGLMKDLAPQLSTLANSAENIKNISEEYKSYFDDISDAIDGLDSKDMRSALDSLIKACDKLKEASLLLKDGLNTSAEVVGDTAKLKRLLKQLTAGFSDMNDAITAINISIENIKNAAEVFFNDVKNFTAIENRSLTTFIDSFKNSLQSIKEDNEDLKRALSDISDVIEKTPAVLSDINLNGLKQAMTKMANASEYLADAMDDVSNSLDRMNSALNNFSEATDALRDAMKGIRSTTDKIKTEADCITDTFSVASAIFTDFANLPEITLPSIDDDFIAKKDKLSDTMGNITDLMGKLSDDTNNSAGDLIGNLNIISDKFFAVTDAFTNAYDNAKDKDIDSLTEDVSDYDDEAQTNGKVSKSENNGNVHGDLNVGGIVGAMAIEYDFDPEDDVTKRGDKSLNFIYKTKAVARSCVNTGKVSAKKNCVGAIAGKEDIGSIIDCLGCGKAESTNGNYVGGIVGQSASTVRQCYSKSIVSGTNYVGGIAGYGYKVYNCLAIAYIEKVNEYKGSICGYSEKDCVFNYFVSEDLGGIDNISYTGKAEPVNYENMLLFENVPDEFRYFTARFKVDEELYKEVTFNYNETLNEDKIPNVPEKKNQYGKWDIESFENLTHDIEPVAEYIDYIRAIESEEKRQNMLPVVIEEGMFGSGAYLTLLREEKIMPPNSILRRERERWTVSVTDDSQQTNKIHYLPEDKSNKIEIYVNNGIKWEKASYTVEGEYFIFDVTSDTVTFSVAKKSMRNVMIVVIILICLAAALVLILIRIMIEIRNER